MWARARSWPRSAASTAASAPTRCASACPEVRDETPMLLLDFATSMVAEGKVLVASNGGKKLPEGALIGPDGVLSSDPATLYGPLESGQRNPGNGQGALRTFGDHKGSGHRLHVRNPRRLLHRQPHRRPGRRPAKRHHQRAAVVLPRPRPFRARRTSWPRRGPMPTTSSPPVRRRRAGRCWCPARPRPARARRRLRDGVPIQATTWTAILRSAEKLGVLAPGGLMSLAGAVP